MKVRRFRSGAPTGPDAEQLTAPDGPDRGPVARARAAGRRLAAPLAAARRVAAPLAGTRQVAAPLAAARRRGGQAAEVGQRVASSGARAAETGARAAGRGMRAAGRGARWSIRRLTDQVLATAPRLPVRDQAALRAQFPGRTPEQVADALIEGAARMTAGVGAAVGTWAALPFLPGFPAEMAAETLTVIGIEIKLVAELHEVFGVRAPGSLVDRMTAYTAAWASRRGVSLAPAGLAVAVESPLRRQLQRRVAARAGRSTASLGPLLTGAAAGALINRHETRRLGRQIRDDLRQRSAMSPQWPD
jgi:hypothetical protein